MAILKAKGVFNNEWRLIKRALKKAIVLGIIIAIILSIKNIFALSGMIPETGVNIKIEKEWKGYHKNLTPFVSGIAGAGPIDYLPVFFWVRRDFSVE